jgi:predicted DNA-binding transcriptional regulator AlpA
MTQSLSNPFEFINEKLNKIESYLSIMNPKQDAISPPPKERFLDQKEVAELFGVSTVSIWQWEKNGFLKSYRIGNLKRFKYTEIVNAPKFINRSNKK